MPADAQSDAAIKQKLISASNGSSCGRRSAWSRAGGYAPLCYASDVTPEMVREYKQSQGER